MRTAAAFESFDNVDLDLLALKMDQRNGLPIVTATSLEGQPVPPRLSHVEGLIPASTVTLLNADGGTGKSLIALQLAVATVTGRPWLGRSTAIGRCLFLTAEDDLPEVHRRLADIVADQGLS